jgi:hypothetical protein
VSELPVPHDVLGGTDDPATRLENRTGEPAANLPVTNTSAGVVG